ncbi:hypothetical protein [Rhizobium sp. NPDC090279]|uniref:hypothetical protein n=1 Tax=Rhizobium sp. NPDC090279 TaxID=3364499 RepID=UPI00383B2B6F
MASSFQVSNALLRTLPRLMSRADASLDQHYESGNGTKAATQTYKRQGAAMAAERIVKRVRRAKPTDEQRNKEIARRRTWAGGGNMPANIRALYSEAERAVLAVIAERCKLKGFCDLCIDEIAKIAGVGRTSVQNAIRKARSKQLAHISVRERPQQGRKSLTNIIKIVCASWLRWIMKAIGFKGLSTSMTRDKNSLFEYDEVVKKALKVLHVDSPWQGQRVHLQGNRPLRAARR